MRMNRRAVERLNPIFAIEEVSPGPMSPEAARAADRHPEIVYQRAVERDIVRWTTATQRLSRDLAIRYQRDISSDHGIDSGCWLEMREGGNCYIHKFVLPTFEFLMLGNYVALNVAADVAQSILHRDRHGRMLVAPPAGGVRAPDVPIRMPSLEFLTSMSDTIIIGSEPMDLPLETE